MFEKDTQDSAPGMISCSVCLETLPPPPASNEFLATLDCGHHYHDLCIKAWSERTNSCPSCRKRFNCVPLRRELNGPVITQLYIDDRDAPKANTEEDRMAAELAQLQEWEIELELENCGICGEGDREQEILVCNGCDRTFHFTCLGLGDVPFCEWCCPSCGDSALYERNEGDHHEPSPPSSSSFGWLIGSLLDDGPHNTLISSTRRQVRRSRSQRHHSSNLNNAISLTSATSIALMEGSGSSNDDDSPPPLVSSRATPPILVRQRRLSPEEARAWQMFERAMDTDTVPQEGLEAPSSTSITEEPSEITPASRRLKRPSRRLTTTTTATRPDDATNSNNNNNNHYTTNISSASSPPATPGFMRGLLTNIRTASSSASSSPPPMFMASSASSPQQPLPAAAPLSSFSLSRSPSPRGGGVVEMRAPINNSSENTANLPTAARAPTTTTTTMRHAVPKSPLVHSSKLPLERKQKVQNLVRDALRPEYRAGKIDKDQYTRINRRVSRQMYDIIVGDDYVRYKDLARQLVDAELKDS